MIVRESPTLVQLRERAEVAEKRLRETDQRLGEVRVQMDGFERKALEAEATAVRCGEQKWLNPTGFSLTLFGASLAMLGGALGGGAPVMGLGVGIALSGVGCFALSMRKANQGVQAALDGSMARLQHAAMALDQGILESERQMQADLARTAREDYESALEPLQMLEPPRGPAIDERGTSVLVGGVTLPRQNRQ